MWPTLGGEWWPKSGPSVQQPYLNHNKAAIWDVLIWWVESPFNKLSVLPLLWFRHGCCTLGPDLGHHSLPSVSNIFAVYLAHIRAKGQLLSGTPKEATPLHPPLPVFASVHILLCLFVVPLSFKVSSHQRFTSQLMVSPADTMVTRGKSLVNQLVAMSPVAKKCSVEQPIGTRALWNDLWLADKCPSWSSFPKAWMQGQGEVQKSSVLSGYLNYNMLKCHCRTFVKLHHK